METTPIPSTRLLQLIDDLKPGFLPLGTHFLALHDEHIRDSYATLLASLLLTDKTISPTELRLFNMVLASMSLPDTLPRLMGRASELDGDGLSDILKTLNTPALIQGFLVDAIVLTRLDGVVNPGQAQVIGEICTVLGATARSLDIVTLVAGNVLDLPEVTRAQVAADFDLSPFSVWQDLVYRELTAERLAAGVQGGLWMVSQSQTHAREIKIEAATLKFLPTACLTVVGTEDAKNTSTSIPVTVQNTTLLNPQMTFQGHLNVQFKIVNINGIYDEAVKITAFRLIDVTQATFSDLKVQTRDARAFYCWSSQETNSTQFEDCTFIKCGNSYLDGGGIAWAMQEKIVTSSIHRSRTYVQNIEKSGRFRASQCIFTECKARFGGGIRANHITKDGITHSKFINCISMSPNPHQEKQKELFKIFSGGSVFARECDGLKEYDMGWSDDSSIIKGCSIENGSVSLGDFRLYSKSGDIRKHNTVTCPISMKERGQDSLMIPITEISDHDLQKLIDHKTLESIRNFSREIQ